MVGMTRFVSNWQRAFDKKRFDTIWYQVISNSFLWQQKLELLITWNVRERIKNFGMTRFVSNWQRAFDKKRFDTIWYQVISNSFLWQQKLELLITWNVRERIKNFGMTRFERATPSSRTKCATKLRYIPLVKKFRLV